MTPEPSPTSIAVFDPAAHRANRNYPPEFKWARLAWALGAVLFRLIPRPFYGLRNALLRAFGARIGRGVRLYPSAEVFFPWNLIVEDDVTVAWGVRLYTLAPIRLRRAAMVSQHATLCAGTHDYRLPNRPLVLRPVEIGPGAWIASEAFIGPGVTVGSHAVVGARAVVVKDLPAWCVAAGNPARVLRQAVPPAPSGARHP